MQRNVANEDVSKNQHNNPKLQGSNDLINVIKIQINSETVSEIAIMNYKQKCRREPGNGVESVKVLKNTKK